jgi:hypothetical protein
MTSLDVTAITFPIYLRIHEQPEKSTTSGS